MLMPSRLIIRLFTHQSRLQYYTIFLRKTQKCGEILQNREWLLKIFTILKFWTWNLNFIHTQATIYIRILNLRNVKNHYKCYMAPGVGTRDANCEAPERTSPSSWSIHVLSRENISLVLSKTFSWNKTNQHLNNWCDKNLFIAPFVMHIGMVAGVGRRRSLRCCAIRSLGILRRPARHVVML